MATKDELSEQLALTAKLAAQVERMAAAAERLNQNYEGQIGAIEKLAAAYEKVNTSGAVQNVEAFNKTLKESAEKAKKSGKTTEQSFVGIMKKVDDAGKAIGTRFPKSLVIGIAALSGFKAGVDNVLALGKGVTGFISGFVDGLVNITASIIAIPFKMFQGLFDMAVKSAGGSNELAEAIEKLRKQFGELHGPTNKAIIDTSKSLKGFSDTGLSAWRVFGTLAQRLDLLRELATEMGATFNKFHKEFEENGGALLAYQKGLGLTNEQMKGIGTVALASGKSMSSTLKDFTKFSKALADSDVDAKLLSRDMGKMAKDVKHFGSLGAKELAEVGTYARKLGIEVEKMTGTLDAFESFDTAAENSAKLAQSFGANIDAFKMMEAQSPADQFDLLRKSMFAVGKTADNMSRQELKLLAQTSGMDEETAKLAFSMKNQGMSLDMIKKKSGDAEKKTMTQAEAMNKLADAIERMTPSGGMNFTSFWDAFLKGIMGGIQSSKEFREIMINIQRAVRTVYMEGVRLGKAIVEIFPGVKQFFGGIADFFAPGKFKKLAGGVTDVLIDWMKSLSASNGQASFGSLMDKLREKFFDFFDSESSSGKKMLEGFKTIFKTVTKIVAEGIKWASDKVTEGVKWITDLVTGKNKIDLAGMGKGELGFLAEVLAPLGEALKHAWTTLAPALWELVKILGKKLFDYLKSPEFIGLIKPALPYVALILFGPAFGRALIAAATASIAQVGTSLLSKAIGGMFTKASSEATKVASTAIGDQSSKLVKELESNIAKMFESKSTKEIQGLSGRNREIESKIAELGKKSPVAEAGGATTSVGQAGAVNKAAGEAVHADKGNEWGVKDAVKLGLKLVAIATAIAIGGVEMALAIMAMRKIMGGLKAADIIPQLMVLGAMVIASLPLMLALKLAKSVGNAKDIIIGGAVVGLAVGIVGVVGAGLAWLLNKVGTPAQLQAAGDIMLKMSLVFLAMVPLLLAAAAIGALVSTGYGALIIVAAGVGMGVISAAVVGMGAVAAGIVKSLAQLQIDASFQVKIDAFLGIMKAIQAFTDSMVSILGLLMPSFTDLFTFTSFKSKIDKAREFMSQLIGQEGSPGGIVGVIEVVRKQVDLIKDAGPDFAKAAEVFATVIGATAELMKAMTPSPEFLEAQSSWKNLINPFIGAMTSMASSKYMESLRASFSAIIPEIKATITELSQLNIPNVENVKAVAGLINGMAGMMKALTPDPKTIEALNESSAGVEYAWGLFKAKGKSDSGAQLKSIMEGQAASVKNVISAITSGPIQAAITSASSFSKEQVEGVKVLSDMMGIITNIISVIGTSMKVKTDFRTDGKGGSQLIKEGVPNIVSFLKDLGEALLPKEGLGLFDRLTAVVRFMPTDKQFLKNLDVAKSLIGFLTEIVKLPAQLKGNVADAKGGNVGQVMAESIGHVAEFLDWLVLSKNGNAPVLERIAYILKMPVFEQLVSMKPKIDSLRSTFSLLSELTTVSKSVRDSIPDAKGGNVGDVMARGFGDTAEFLEWMVLSKNGKEPVLGRIVAALKSPHFSALNAAKGMMDSLKGTFTTVSEVGIASKINIPTDQLGVAYASMDHFATFLTDLVDPLSGPVPRISDSSGVMKTYVNSLKTGGVIPALEAINKMYKQVNELNEALGKPSSINIKAKLGELATAVGLGGKASYTINPSRNVEITVNMHVEVNAADMERALIMRETSVIRNRLNWATENPSTAAQPSIPGSPDKSLPMVKKNT